MKRWILKTISALTPKKSEWSRKWDEGHAAGQRGAGIDACPYRAACDRLPWVQGYQQAGKEERARARRGYRGEIQSVRPSSANFRFLR